MIGKYSYDQLNEIIKLLTTSTGDLRSVLEKYNNDDNLSMRATKLLSFCDELDKYSNDLVVKIQLNKDADDVVNRLVNNE